MLITFFGTQSGDSEKAMSECEEQLKCAGFVTTANILFPDMEDDMSFEDFFSLIGVDDYEYFGGRYACSRLVKIHVSRYGSNGEYKRNYSSWRMGFYRSRNREA